MKNLILMIALMAVAYGQGLAQSNAKLVVKVININSSKGSINVAVFNSEVDFLEQAFMQKKKDAKPGELVFEFAGMPDGEYTVSVIHDENGNGELDKNFIGIPSEPYGISKEGKSNFGPPNYGKALFTVGNSNISLSISL